MPDQPALRKAIVLGTAMWGWTLDEAACFDILDTFYGLGFRQIDAATNYPINKKAEDFRKAEKILAEWIKRRGVTDLRVFMKVGSVNNMRSPDHNLTKSFLLLALDQYQNLLGSNLDTIMVHWDNRSEGDEIEKTFEAFAHMHQLGLQLGLSGIRHPEIYASLNNKYQFPFSIQFKNNLLQSDYARYAAFHGNSNFYAYGINAGGLKLPSEGYPQNSTLSSRGGEHLADHPILGQIEVLLNIVNKDKGRPEISQFSQCAAIYSWYNSGIKGILLGVSNKVQLLNNLHFFKQLEEVSYEDLYRQLLTLVVNTQTAD
ncbi:MAG TPA: aldo/keto reductase [Saprospiraceae bacterium]|nr:aldo/keto reductase [Saprospiraceae bacterium]HMQ82567.1 aldo/keto reductase [Saprospiraceae bacterium]